MNQQNEKFALSRILWFGPMPATHNFLVRDQLIANIIRNQASARNLEVLEIDGSLTPQAVATIVEQHFTAFLTKINSATTRSESW